MTAADDYSKEQSAFQKIFNHDIKPKVFFTHLVLWFDLIWFLKVLGIFKTIKIYHNQNLVNDDNQPNSSLFYVYTWEKNIF